MAQTLAVTEQHPVGAVQCTKSHRIPILHMFKHKKINSHPGDDKSQTSDKSHKYLFSHEITPDPSSSQYHLTLASEELISHTTIAEEYSNLHSAILSHVHEFYSPNLTGGVVTQAIIQHASTGIMIPWPQVRSLLNDSTTTLSTLSLCITWTILSRSLLLKLGVSSSPGSSFLPPEIVECFQSFSLNGGAVSLEQEEANTDQLILLSRWKQISATLLIPTYISSAFAQFDSRTVNIERALKDLDPLLSAYAIPRDDGQSHRYSMSNDGNRFDSLRKVLQLGAKFAFMLFAQPDFWKFDWTSEDAGKHGNCKHPVKLDRVPSFETGLKMAARRSSAACSSWVGGNHSCEGKERKWRGGDEHGLHLSNREVVIWPQLVRVMDGKGKMVNEGIGKKLHMGDFDESC